MMARFLIAFLLSCAVLAEAANKTPDASSYVRADMNFLASDALQGRGSATRDELLAATYIASQLEKYGIHPVNGSYLQVADIERLQLDGPVRLNIGDERLNPETDFRTLSLSGQVAAGSLKRLSPADAEKADGIVFLPASSQDDGELTVRRALDFSNASLVLVGTTEKSFEEIGRLAHSPRLPAGLKGEPKHGENLVVLSPAATQMVQAQTEGTPVSLNYQTKTESAQTYNAIGILPGSRKELRDQAILLSAHLDHLGVGKAVNGDSIYNGADDDASGVTAVLELARFLGGKKHAPRRTVVFALFGSEESGGYGNRYFIEHPPVPLEEIVANLEFEMIGRADPKVQPDELWLTGWERTDLGQELAQRGAKLVADPRPDQQFFQRSDNYALAKQGVVAQTVSSFGLGDYYHQPSDDLEHIDFNHLTRAIESLHKPVDWLVNTSWKPEWKPGQKP
jgi:aminopeptidase YwaD